MSNYFVDPVNGSDSTGTGSVGTPWATIGKAIGTSPAITMSGSGDTLWLIPSGPNRQRNVAIALSPSVGNVLTIQGDYDGAAQRAAGSSTPITGVPIWTAFTTNDSTWPADTNGVLSLNGKSYVTIQDIVFIGGRNTTASCLIATATSTNITIKYCAFISAVASVPALSLAFTAPAAISATWMIDSCLIMGTTGIWFTLNQYATSEYSIASTVQNCILICQGTGISINAGGSTTNNGYGLTVLNSTFFCGVGAIGCQATTGTNTSTNYWFTVYNSLLLCIGSSSNALKCQNSTNSHGLEDYNQVYGTLSNVTSGGHSGTTAGTNTVSPNVHTGEERLFGFAGRPFLSPWSGSPLLGFGAGGTPPSLDFLGKPRPAGGSSLTSAVGYLERQDTGAKEASIVQASTNSIKIVGPGTQEIQVAVDATSTTIGLYMYADSNHGTGTPPQAVILANGEIGIAVQTITMSPTTTGQWNSMTFSAITPTAKGVVTIRLVSRPTAANGIAYFDTMSIA